MNSKPEDRFKEQKTYETFERDAKEAGLYDTFAQDDLDIAKQDTDYGYRLLRNKQGYVNADTEEDKQSYVDLAAYDRAQYQQKTPTVPQTSGKQSDASANILSIIKQYDDSLPGDKKSPWMSTVDSLLGQIAGDKFSYDAESDPKYALAQKYAEQAMKAQQAESAMLTGGYGNSYGAAIGQQVYTDYMEDAVADMEQNAYNRWAAERDNKYNLLGIAQGLEQQEYDRAWNEEAREYEQEANSRSELLAKAQVLASYGNFSGYKALGYTDEEIASMQQKYNDDLAYETTLRNAELAELYDGVGGGSANPFDYSALYAQLQEQGVVSAEGAYNALLGAGYSDKEASGIAAGFVSGGQYEDTSHWSDIVTTDKGNVAIEKWKAFFLDEGVPYKDVLNPREFAAQVNQNGYAEVKIGKLNARYKNYSDYISDYVDHYE